MKIVIDTDVSSKEKISLREILLFLFIRNGGIYDDVLSRLIDEEAVMVTPDGYITSQGWKDRIDQILLDSDRHIPTEEELIPFAKEMMDIMPPGKMVIPHRDGSMEVTPYYYKCNKHEVAQKLRKFFKKYGNKYSKEDILDATRRYVEFFRENKQGMRILKYFIMKNTGGEETSDLLTFLENKTDEDISNNWMDNVI